MSALISISSPINQVSKLDIEKAYDYVSWTFLMAILEKMASQANGEVGCIFVYLRFAILCWLMVKLQRATPSRSIISSFIYFGDGDT